LSVSSGLWSARNLRDQHARNISQSHVPAVEVIGQPAVIDAHQVEHAGMYIVIGHRLFFGSQTHIIAGPNCLTALDSSARHEDRLCARVVVAPDAALGNRHAAELGMKDDQSLVQKTTTLQIRDQRRDRLIDLPGMLPVVGIDAVVASQAFTLVLI